MRPRVVLVSRKSSYEALIEHQGTKGQAQFFLQTRGQTLATFEEAHRRFQENLSTVLRSIPADQRRVQVEREQIDRFIFAPDDIVLVVGQDGLVPNTAKYLKGQLVIGVNSDPGMYDGVLCRHAPEQVPALLTFAEQTIAAGGSPPLAAPFARQRRTMAEAERDDGLRLLALNEVFLGHCSHQSARYRLIHGRRTERQSSSGVICSTGTGSTGWARSLALQQRRSEPLPVPEDRLLAWFVREPFPSVSTGTSLDFGLLADGEELVLCSEMSEGGVVFADGIEQDRLDFSSGQLVKVRLAEEALQLVVPALPGTGGGRDEPPAGRGMRRGDGR